MRSCAIMALIRVTSLLATELNEAQVLAGLGAIALDPETWRRDTLALMSDAASGGVLLARTEAGRACGLLHYRILGAGDDGPCLQVERLVAFDLTEPRRIADRLITEVTRLARLQRCDSLRLVRPLDSPADASALVLASGVADLHSVF